jgi:hypothetical protein
MHAGPKGEILLLCSFAACIPHHRPLPLDIYPQCKSFDHSPTDNTCNLAYAKAGVLLSDSALGAEWDYYELLGEELNSSLFLFRGMIAWALNSLDHFVAAETCPGTPFAANTENNTHCQGLAFSSSCPLVCAAAHEKTADPRCFAGMWTAESCTRKCLC